MARSKTFNLLEAYSMRSNILLPAPNVWTLLASHLRTKPPVLNLQDASVLLQSVRITRRRTQPGCSLVPWHSLSCGGRCRRSLFGFGGPSLRSHQSSIANSGQGHSQECRGCIQKQFESRARNQGMSKLVDTWQAFLMAAGHLRRRICILNGSDTNL